MANVQDLGVVISYSLLLGLTFSSTHRSTLKAPLKAMVIFGCILVLGCVLEKDLKPQSIMGETERTHRRTLPHHHEGKLKSILQLPRVQLLQEISSPDLPSLQLLHQFTGGKSNGPAVVWQGRQKPKTLGTVNSVRFSSHQRVALKVTGMKNGLSQDSERPQT